MFELFLRESETPCEMFERHLSKNMSKTHEGKERDRAHSVGILAPRSFVESP